VVYCMWEWKRIGISGIEWNGVGVVGYAVYFVFMLSLFVIHDRNCR